MCRRRGQNWGAISGPQGSSQCVPSNGRDEEAPVRVTSQGGVSVEVGVRASALWAKHEIRPRAGSLERCITATLSGRFGAWRCHGKTMVIHSDQMKSHVVFAGRSSRENAIYKATPKGCVMRRIREAVSGSTDLWDGSRAVVAFGSSLLPCWGWGAEVKRKTVSSEQAWFDVDMGKLAARLKPPNGPPGPLSGNPAFSAKKRLAIPVRSGLRQYRDWRLSCPRSLKPTP